MRKIAFFILVNIVAISVFAQAPEKVNYQAVARNLAGNPLVNQAIVVRYEIRQNTPAGTVVYAETHNLTTNQFGLFTAEIGGGTVNTGTFAGIAWGTSPFYLYVEVDGDPMGVTQLLSVPYALYAKESGNGPAGLPGKNSLSVSSAYSGPLCSANGGNQIEVGLDDNNDGVLQALEIDYTYYVCNGTDGITGSNGLNTLSSTVASTSCANGGVTVNMGLDANNNSVLDASEISLSYDVCNGIDGTSGTTYFAGTGISLSSDTITNLGDADADPTNEIQVLSISNDTIFLSNGGFAPLPSAGGYWVANGNDIHNSNTANVGIGTNNPPQKLSVLSNDSIIAGFLGTNPQVSAIAVANTNLGAATGIIFYNGTDTSSFIFLDPTSKNFTLHNKTIGGNIILNTEKAIVNQSEILTNEIQDLIYNRTDTIFNQSPTGTIIHVNQGSFLTDSLYVLGVNAANTNWILANDGTGQAKWIDPSTIISGTADNWGTDVVNTSGTNISGDGTAGNPLTVTETTSTLVDNADGTFTYTDETGTPITFDANINDADADSTNELQVLSFSNDTLYLSNGNSVYIPAAAGDNWGTDTVAVSGTNISGNGTAGNPLVVTETTSTLVDNGNGTFTYTDETGTPITFDANINDADADSTNELQVLSFSNDTLYLSNGGSVYIAPAAGDNWGTDTVAVSGTNISGNGTAGNPLVVTETTSTLVDNGNGTFTYTDETGTPITFDANINDADADSTNELQVLSFSNDTLYLSNGNSVYIPAAAGDNWGTDTVAVSGTNISGNGTAGNPLVVTETTSTLVDNGNGTFTYTDETGTPITFDANINDADADSTNELQVLSFSNDTLYLSNGGSVYIAPAAGDNWGTDVVNTSGTNISGNGTAGNPLVVTETTSTLVDNGNGTFTYTDETGTPITFDANINDADADSTNELQVLSFSNDTLYLSNGGSVYIAPAAGDNWGTDVVNTSGTNISGNGTSGNPLVVTETTSTLVDNGNGTFTYTNETGGITTFNANINDADSNSTNELQVLSFSNDTLYLSNGGSVYIAPAAGDNWGTDVVNTSGTNISGNGTAGNPLVVTETTSTLVDNGNGTFTYTDETGTPITFDANINDADADSTNELQVLSFSNDTLYLSNGGSVYIAPAAGDNWGTDVVNTSGTNISGNGTAGNPLVVTETTSTLVDNGNGTFTYTDETGTPITFDANINDADADSTNELQVLSFSNDTLYLSNGGSVYIAPAAGDNWGTQTVITDATLTGNGTAGSPLSVNGILTDNQNLSNGGKVGNNQTINISGGTGVTFSVADADSSLSNEVITNFGINGTNDSLVINEAGLNWAVPLSSFNSGNNWSILGNSGTGASNFIGTTDAQPLMFRTSGTDRLRLTLKGQLEIFNTGYSVFIGEGAGANDDLSNNSNVFVGYQAGLSNTAGGNNTALGHQTLSQNSTGNSNTALGYQSLNNNLTGSNNIAIGFNTLRDHSVGDNNVAVGNQAGMLNTNGVGNVFLGHNAGRNETGSDKLYIDNSNTSSPLIYGDFSTNMIRVNGSLNINNAYTFPTIDGTANYLMKTDGAGNLSWVDPSSLGISGWSLTGNAGTGASNFIGTTDAQDLRFRTNNTEKMVITQSGNIGMGVAAPLAHLHISRDGSAVAGIMSAGNYSELTLLRSNGTKAAPSHVLTNDRIGALDFVGYNSVQGWTVGEVASIDVFATEDYSASGLRGSKMRFNVSQNGGAGTLQAMTIDNFGNVGIGTSSPTALLHLEKSTGTSMIIRETVPTTGAVLLMHSLYEYMLISNNNGIFRIQDNTNSRTPFNISNSGYIGIGGDAQYSELDVYGKITMRIGATAGYIPVSDNNGTMTWTDPSTLGLGGAWTSNSGNTYLNNLNDKVGIGINNPAEELHIVDNISLRPQVLLETTAANFAIGYRYKTASSEWMMGQIEGTGNQFRIKDITNNRITLAINQSNGNVGVGGTVTPNSTLTVNGDVGLNDGTTIASNNAVTILLENSGPNVLAGDIVIIGTADNTFSTTNSQGHYAVIGVATEAINAGMSGKIAISGVATVNVGSAAVNRGQHCITGTVAGRASGITMPSAGTSIGVFLTDGPASGTAKVLLR